MKIILNSIYDVEDFLSILSPEYVKLVHASSEDCGKLAEQVTKVQTVVQSVHGQEPTSYDPMAEATYGHDLHPEGYAPVVQLTPDEEREETRRQANGDDVVEFPDGLPDAIAAPESATIELDATGRPWDEEIDSAAKTKTAKGIWTRSRRRDLTDERYAERCAELVSYSKTVAQLAAEEVAGEPVATETHALPTDKPAGVDKLYPFAALIEESREAAGELAGDMQPLLVAARDFIGLYGTAAKDALLDAVVAGQSIPAIRDPSDRRLLQACMKNYGSFL